MKRIAVLGATGSIGRAALDIIRARPDLYKVSVLANYSDLAGIKLLEQEFNPDICISVNAGYYSAGGKVCPMQKDALSDPNIYSDTDIAVNGIGGLDGLMPAIAVINSPAILAIANKESFVCAGSFIVAEKKRLGKVIYPLDSEHNTVWQCLDGQKSKIKSIILTASGGAFRDYSLEMLKTAKASDALRHPNWVMGKKVTVDSATLANKGMELIEAKYLFECENIRVVTHRESIVHALVEFADNSMLAGMSNPDMRLPIQYALSYPKRQPCAIKPLDLAAVGTLHFGNVDEEKFPCFALAKLAFDAGDSLGTVFNSANDVAVKAYLQERISFFDIPALIRGAYDKFGGEKLKELDDVFSIDRKVREYTLNNIIRREQ